MSQLAPRLHVIGLNASVGLVKTRDNEATVNRITVVVMTQLKKNKQDKYLSTKYNDQKPDNDTK